ncbi:hypothetical protein NKH95_33265, partial [Mesorhizobium sp. M0848]|uniref:hypothetical protein n=1 Tax=Mesorhizobium sp. M0848 TaxID=2957012 RepID=UPI003335EE67
CCPWSSMRIPRKREGCDIMYEGPQRSIERRTTLAGHSTKCTGARRTICADFPQLPQEICVPVPTPMAIGRPHLGSLIVVDNVALPNGPPYSAGPEINTRHPEGEELAREPHIKARR